MRIEVKTKEKWPIHRAAPKFTDQVRNRAISNWDKSRSCSICKRRKIGLFGERCRKNSYNHGSINIAKAHGGFSFAGVGERTREGNDLSRNISLE